jgi:ferric-dicitrate binding protein FerR (iron transport regulator)
MKYDDTDSNELELAALQWFEYRQVVDANEPTLEAHRRWLETPANAQAYTKVEQIFALIRTLADSPEMALLSEATNKRIEGYAPAYSETRRNLNRTVKTSPEKSK